MVDRVKHSSTTHDGPCTESQTGANQATDTQQGENTMISNDQFKKLTGVNRNDDAATLEKALGKAVANQRTVEIGQAFILRELIAVHNWRCNEAAPSVGLTPNTARRLGNRGRILNLCGFASVSQVYASLAPLSDPEMTLLYDACMKADTEEAATATAIRFAQTKVVAARLGDNATEEKVTALCEHLTAKGITSPVETRSAIPAAATTLEIELPKAKRTDAPQNKTDGKDTPTIETALTALNAWKTDRIDGSDEASPFTMSDAEVMTTTTAILSMVAAMLASHRLEDVSLMVGDILTMTDEYESKMSDRAAAEVTREFLATEAMGANL